MTEKKSLSKAYVLEYSEKLQAIIFRILDSEGMYPICWQDPDSGTYKIDKNRNRKIQMTK